jgi:hypothetical protein
VREAAVRGFGQCFIDRSHEEDPAAVPASCRGSAGAQLPPAARRGVQAVLATAATQARKDTFAAAVQVPLEYEVGVFLATVGLLFLLPRAVRSAGSKAQTPPREATRDLV